MTEAEILAIEGRLCPDNCDACADAHRLIQEVRRLARYEAAVKDWLPAPSHLGYMAQRVNCQVRALIREDAGVIGDGDAPAPARAAGGGEETR